MIRRNCCTTAGSGVGEVFQRRWRPDPLMDVSGARSSWLTIPRNSDRKTLQLLKRCQILHGDDHGLVCPIFGSDRCSVHQCGDAPPRRALGGRSPWRVFWEALLSTCAAESSSSENLPFRPGAATSLPQGTFLDGVTRCDQDLGYPLHLSIEQHWSTGFGVEDHDA